MSPSAMFDKKNSGNDHGSIASSESDDSAFLRRKTKSSIWRPYSDSVSSLINFTRKSSILESTCQSNAEDEDSRVSREEKIRFSHATKDDLSKRIVSVVIVEAKGLPNVQNDGSSHVIYCKIRLGYDTLKSKSVPSSQHPIWQDRLQFNRNVGNLLRVTLWDKGKQKSFMGSCVLDLSQLEKERTHKLWAALDDGYGMVHLSITMCHNHRSSNIFSHLNQTNVENKYTLLRSLEDWDTVGELQVRVLAAKGLSGKSYCLLEVDNERVWTHSVSSSPEAVWDKKLAFKVYDITSTLDLKVYDSSLVSAFRQDVIGRVSIPLLRINNGELRWFALKDKHCRNIAKKNCPRVLLEMTLYWNPIKASLKLFKPKEVKYNKKAPLFDIALVYKNLEFVNDAFIGIMIIDDGYKNLFEWKNQESCWIALICWLFFWYHFSMWVTPLLLLTPFLYFWTLGRMQEEKSFMRGYGIVEETSENNKDKTERSLTGRLQELPEMTLRITDGIEYLASLSEKLYNLASFKVPFLSYLTMILLIVASIIFYLIPFNYIMMIFGIFKFSRKYFDPERMLNNDIVDFFSRIPDTEELKNWKEFNVPEPSPKLIYQKETRSLNQKSF